MSTLGKEIATYYVDNTGAVPVVTAEQNVQMTVDGVEVGLGSDGTSLLDTSGADATDWCVALENDLVDGDNVWQYSATDGLQGPLAADTCPDA